MGKVEIFCKCVDSPLTYNLDLCDKCLINVLEQIIADAKPIQPVAKTPVPDEDVPF